MSTIHPTAIHILNQMINDLNYINLDKDILPSFERCVNYSLPNNMDLTPIAELFMRKLYNQKCNDVSRYYWNLPSETYKIRKRNLHDHITIKPSMEETGNHLPALLKDRPSFRSLMGYNYQYWDGEYWCIDFDIPCDFENIHHDDIDLIPFDGDIEF